MLSPSRRLSAAAVVLTAALGLSACSSPDSQAEEPASPSSSATTEDTQTTEASWPRTITHELGETVVDSAPTSIASTSLTVTGTLLAIDAPVTSSAATTPGNGSSDLGFFDQWSDVAKERGVEVLYPDLEFDLEAVIAADPDLIFLSTTGADSAADHYDELSEIAPTIAIDYSSQSWQDLSAELGVATGHEEDAAAAVEAFDAKVATTAAAITVPEGTVNAVVFNGAAGDTAFAKPGGSHGQLLTALGFEVVGADEALDTSTRQREDFAFVSLENTVTALTAPTVFIISGTQEQADMLLAEPVLANAPAVVAKAVYPLGDESFRMDFFSGGLVLDAVAAAFS